MKTTNVSPEGALGLTFAMVLPQYPSPYLQTGNFKYKGKESIFHSWTCTSGLPNYQYSGSTRLKGKGPIPSCEYAQVECYEVSTKAVDRSQVKGVEGSFYPIAPYLVTLKGGLLERGDFGVHFDANVPGSSGCIVFRIQREWDEFRLLMNQFQLSKIDKLRLHVRYS